jgi:uncharacterized protein YcgI (DUF1989 family)
MIDMVVPAGEGRAAPVLRGQTLRIYLVEGQQVGDLALVNMHRHSEHLHVGQTWARNVMLHNRTSRAYSHFYSNPPFENLLCTTIADPVADHFGSCGGRCSRRLLEIRDGKMNARGCQENLSDALAAFGVKPEQIGDCFNVFMRVELHPDGGFSIKPPNTKAGDYLELRAEMDLLVGLSACPNATGPTNNYRAKPLGMRVYDPE